MRGACSVVSGPPRGAWRAAPRGLDLVVEGDVVARVRPMPVEGWFWFGLRCNSSQGKGARPFASPELARGAASARAREVFVGLELDDGTRRGPRPPAIEALDAAQPALAHAGVGLDVRMNLFCRAHLIGALPERVTAEQVNAVREAVAAFHRAGAWPDELVEYAAR